MRKELQNFLAIPDVIAARQNFSARSEQFLSQPWRDPEARCGILAIGDAQIHVMLLERVGQAIVNDLPAGTSYDIAYKEDPHVTLHSKIRHAARATARKFFDLKFNFEI
jgi:hypothetical protein